MKLKSLACTILLLCSLNLKAQEWWDISYHQGSGTNSNTITRDTRPAIVNTDTHSPSAELERQKNVGSAQHLKAARKKSTQLSKEREAALLRVESEERNFGESASNCMNCWGIGIQNCKRCLTTGFNECTLCNGKGDQVCKTCRGTGAIRELATCTACGGTGRMVCISCVGKGKVVCTHCSGVGYDNCENCHGAGKQFRGTEPNSMYRTENISPVNLSAKKRKRGSAD